MRAQTRLRVLAIGLVVILVMAACGSDDKKDNNAKSSGSSSSGVQKSYFGMTPIICNHASTSCGQRVMGDSVGRSPKACPPFA